MFFPHTNFKVSTITSNEDMKNGETTSEPIFARKKRPLTKEIVMVVVVMDIHV